MQRVDVAVIGAGPAGSAAAITLAKHGRDVLLVDRARFPRDKCCGDGLTTLALRELDGLGLETRGLPSHAPVDAAWIRSPSGRVVSLPLPRNHGSFAEVATRTELDHALVRRAQREGARLLEGAALTNACTNAWDSVIIELDGVGLLECGHVIAADGMWSPVRRCLGLALPGYHGEWHAVRRYFSGCGPLARRLWIWFEPELLPGYAWSFPLAGDRANVGFGVSRRTAHSWHGRDIAKLWGELMTRPHIADVLGDASRADGPTKAWPIPARVDQAVLSAANGRVLFTGDAAGATDVLTGEGIGQALLTGRLAAEAVIEAKHTRSAGDTYSAAVRRDLLADHQMSAALSGVLARPRGARAAVRVAATNAWTRRNFARWLFEDEPRAIAFTPGRWHHHFLRRDGV